MKKILCLLSLLLSMAVSSPAQNAIVSRPTATKVKPDKVKPENAKPEKKEESRPQRKADKPHKQPAAPVATTGSLDLGYGVWHGGLLSGKPDGEGTLTFYARHNVDPSVSYTANPGDYFKATYDRGSLISGKLYDSDGNKKKTIIP